jgi:uncharacterized phage protein gp47/JayE
VAYKLPIPDYLNEDEETIHRRMLEKAPPGIDTSEGSFFWDTTRPGAIEKAQLVQFTLQNLLQIFFVQTSYGQYLDYLGQVRGVTRLPATPSAGKVKFTGQPGTVINAGTRVSTQSSTNSSAIIFETTESGVINEQGEVTVIAVCTETGTIGNVPTGVIVLMAEPVEGVTSVTNPEPFTGGTNIEDDDVFRERILDTWRLPATSGNKTHYRLWAREVPGVGDAKVFPLWNGPGTVKVVIVDGNKRAANSELLDAVTTHIEEMRPIGADVTVASATEKQINITANVSLASGYTIAQVQQLYEEAVTNFLKEIVLVETYVSYAQLGKLLLETPGVGDYANLLVNGSTANVLLGGEEIPVLGTVTLEVME